MLLLLRRMCVDWVRQVANPHFCIEEGCLHWCPFSATVVVVPLWVTLTVHA